MVERAFFWRNNFWRNYQNISGQNLHSASLPFTMGLPWISIMALKKTKKCYSIKISHRGVFSLGISRTPVS